MIRRAMVIAAGVLAAACFACVPQPAAPPPATMAGPVPRTDCPAMNNIQILQDFDYHEQNHQFFDPAEGKLAPAPKFIINSIWAAYNIAPDFFQQELCKLNGIYIVPHGDSWGVRNRNLPLTRYVVLSEDLWAAAPAKGLGGPSPKDPLSQRDDEVARLTNLTGSGKLDHPPQPPGATYDPAYDPTVTILGVLAHEYGHVLFYDTFVQQPGGAPDYQHPDDFCGNFFGQSWDMLPDSPITWRYYDGIDGTHKPGDVDIHQLHSPSVSPTVKAELLDLFYSRRGTGRWASLWAAFSPDHDFIETFRLFVLLKMKTKQPLRSLPINLYPAVGKSTHDIVGSCSDRAVLMHKLACFQHKFCRNSSANPCASTCQP